MVRGQHQIGVRQAAAQSPGGDANGPSAVAACVIRNGCSIRLSTPPRLSASVQTFVRATIATATGEWSKVLAVLGQAIDDVPIVDGMDALAAVVRANAHEQLGDVDRARDQLSQLMLTIRDVRRSANPALRIEGVVLTMHDIRNRLTAQVEADARANMGELVMNTTIPRNVRISEAPSHALPASTRIGYFRHGCVNPPTMVVGLEVRQVPTHPPVPKSVGLKASELVTGPTSLE